MFFWFGLVSDVGFSVLSGLVVLLPSAELLQLPLLVQVPAPPAAHTRPAHSAQASPSPITHNSSLNSLPV